MKVYATMDDLTAEVRQLRDELERERAYARRLAADNARLRGALRRIRDGDYPTDPHGHTYIARAALEGE